MGEIVFVGLGLYNEMGISLRGLEEMKTADKVFIEFYTSLMPELLIENLEGISGKKLCVGSRQELEEENGEVILKAAETGKAVLPVPAGPSIIEILLFRAPTTADFCSSVKVLFIQFI